MTFPHQFSHNSNFLLRSNFESDTLEDKICFISVSHLDILELNRWLFWKYTGISRFCQFIFDFYLCIFNRSFSTCHVVLNFRVESQNVIEAETDFRSERESHDGKKRRKHRTDKNHCDD
jgi:hypothetical protein